MSFKLSIIISLIFSQVLLWSWCAEKQHGSLNKLEAQDVRDDLLQDEEEK